MTDLIWTYAPSWMTDVCNFCQQLTKQGHVLYHCLFNKVSVVLREGRDPEAKSRHVTAHDHDHVHGKRPQKIDLGGYFTVMIVSKKILVPTQSTRATIKYSNTTIFLWQFRCIRDLANWSQFRDGESIVRFADFVVKFLLRNYFTHVVDEFLVLFIQINPIRFKAILQYCAQYLSSKQAMGLNRDWER